MAPAYSPLRGISNFYQLPNLLIREWHNQMSELQTPPEGTEEQEQTTPQAGQEQETPETPTGEVVETPNPEPTSEQTPPDPQQPEQPAAPDYKQKFIESGRESILNAERVTAANARIEQLTKTDTPTDEAMRQLYPEWDQLKDAGVRKLGPYHVAPSQP